MKLRQKKESIEEYSENRNYYRRIYRHNKKKDENVAKVIVSSKEISKRNDYMKDYMKNKRHIW